MKQRFNALFIAYRQATGEDPPPWEAALEGEGTLDSYLQAQKRARLAEEPDAEFGQDLPKLSTRTKASNWGSLHSSKFTASQEEAMMQAESQKQLSPVRQTRASRSGRTDRGAPPVHTEKPKTSIFPPPPVLNLAGATIVEPVGRITRSKPATSVQSNNRNNASTSSGRSPKKATVPSSLAHLLVQPEHPAFTSNAHASTSTSQQHFIMLPQGDPHHGLTRTYNMNTSSANRNGYQSAVVRKHVKNLEQRRKQAEAYDQAEARRGARAEQHKEELRLRKADHRAFVERRSKELQIEMGVDLGDFPPPGIPPLKDRWTTVHIGETKYAPLYVTPEPVVKTEEEPVSLNEDEPQAGADQQDKQESRHVNPPENEDYDRDDEGEDELYHDEIAGDGDHSPDEIAGDGDRYHEEFIPSQEGSQFEPEDDAPENTHYQFLRGDTRYRYAGPATKSTAGATDGSYTSRKSKRGERQDSPEEEIVNEVQEDRPTKRRRMARQDPVSGSSNHQTALAGPSNHPTALTANPPANASSAPNQAERRSSTRLSTQRRTKAATEAKRLKGVAQYIHNAGPVPKRGWDGKVPKGANGTKKDLLSRREELHRMYVFTEDGPQEVPELMVATEFRTEEVESDLDNDPIAGQMPVRDRSKRLSQSSMLTLLLAFNGTFIPPARLSILARTSWLTSWLASTGNAKVAGV
jgi:hypothetical protein